MTAAQDIAKIRTLANAVHSAAQGARHGEPADALRLLEDVSLAPVQLLAAIEDLDGRLRLIEGERRSRFRS